MTLSAVELWRGRQISTDSRFAAPATIHKLIDLKCNLHVIDSVCRSADNPAMLHRCAVVSELMLARDNLVHISELSGSSFSSVDVVTMLDWACVY